MLDIRGLLQFLDLGFILRLLYLVLLCSLIPIVDMFLVLELVDFIPKYALLSGITASGLLGLLLSYIVIRKVLDQMHYKIKYGEYPRDEFFELIGLMPAAVLLITPGLIGDLIGLFLLMPALRRALGKALSGETEDKFKELYEYLKIYEL